MTRLILTSLLLGGAVPSQAPLEPFRMDSRFVPVAMFGEIQSGYWGIRDDSWNLVVLGGPDHDWMVQWDLSTGQQKGRVRAPALASSFESRSISPSGRHLFHKKAKKGDTDTVVYYDTVSGKAGQTATFNTTGKPQFKISGGSMDECSLIDRFGGGFHPRETALRELFEKTPGASRTTRRSFTGDWQHLVAASDVGRLLVADTIKPRFIAEMPLPPLGDYDREPLFADLSSDRGKMAIRAGVNEILVIDLKKKEVDKRLLGHTGKVSPNFDLSPDGTRLISGSEDRTVRLWDTTDGKEILRHEAARGALALRFPGKGPVAGLFADTRAVHVLGPDGARLRTVRPWLSRRAVLTQDGRFALDHDDDVQFTTVAFHQLDPQECLWERVFPGRIQHTSITPDGRHVLVTTTQAAHVVETASNAVTWSGPVPSGSLVGLLPGGGSFVTWAPRALAAWNLASGANLWSVEFPTALIQRRPALNGTGTHLAFVAGIPVVVDAREGKIVSGTTFLGVKDSVLYRDAMVSGDGQTLALHRLTTREIEWWSLQGEQLKVVAYDKTALPSDQDGFFASADARRVYLSAPPRLLVVSFDRGQEPAWQYHPTAVHQVRFHGDFLLIEGSGWSSLMRFTAPAGK